MIKACGRTDPEYKNVSLFKNRGVFNDHYDEATVFAVVI